MTVHVDRRGRVYLVKNRAVPEHLLPPVADFRLGRSEAILRARRALERRGRGKTPQAARRLSVQTTEALWFPKDERLVPAWRVRLKCGRPREEWILYVDARTGAILSRYDNLAAATGRATVFDPSPVTQLGDHRDLLGPRRRPRRPPSAAYRTVTLHGLSGNGRLEGRRVTTRPTDRRRRVQRSDHAFFLAAHERGFEEAMVYYHIDAAVRYLERLGFRDSRAIFASPVEVNVYGTRDDNSWYSPWERRLTFGTGEIDDAEDGETILHELGHAIQDAICPDFGQSTEAAAMGEGFGDYFAASFFAERKPPRYRLCVMTWDGLLLGLRAKLTPPCLRRVDGPWAYDDFDPDGDEHDNGEIWSAALWDVRKKLGRLAADRIIVESHFQLDGFTTFARGARAILDADAHLNRGRNRDSLRRIFRRRNIGPL